MSGGSAGPAILAHAAPLFAALGDETRLAVVDRLCAAGLVQDSQRGRDRNWELDTARLDEARRCLDKIAQEWDAALERLQVFVEDEPGRPSRHFN